MARNRNTPAAKLNALLANFPKVTKRQADDICDRQLREYGNHLVGLTALCQDLDEQGQPKGKAGFFYYSGFIMNIRRSWWWVTAGHIISNIEQERLGNRVQITKYRLVDHFGTGRDQSCFIPFEYEDAEKIFTYDKDNEVDYGLIRLSPYYVQLLKRNNIRSIPAREWKRSSHPVYDYFFMIGLPEDAHNPSIDPTEDGYIVRAKAQASAFYLHPILKPLKTPFISKYHLFIAKVGSKDDISGMSGGPIFGVTLVPFSTRIVALQAGWRRKPRINFGLPIATIGRLAEEEIDRRNPKLHCGE